MSITTRQVGQIAALAKLALTPAEAEAMARELGSILDHMRDLEVVELGGAAPLVGVTTHPAPLRADEPGADLLERGVRDFAPAWQENLFSVPRLAALDTEVSQGESS